jgi:hypothetical protein
VDGIIMQKRFEEVKATINHFKKHVVKSKNIPDMYDSDDSNNQPPSDD